MEIRPATNEEVYAIGANLMLLATAVQELAKGRDSDPAKVNQTVEFVAEEMDRLRGQLEGREGDESPEEGEPQSG